MLDIGRFYLFTPPYSETEHFVEVTAVKTRDVSYGNLPDSQQKKIQYVHYKHANADVEGSTERATFEKNATELSLETIDRVLEGIGSEIERLEQNKQKFEEIKEVVHARQGQRKAEPEAKNGQSISELVSDAEAEEPQTPKTKRVVTDEEG